MRMLVTGGAGFIGAHLVDRLLAAGHEVVAYDNFSTGQEQFLQSASVCPGFALVRADTLDQEALRAAMAGCDRVYHLAANADVRFGPSHPHKDLEQNIIATFQVLEAMRSHRIRQIVFPSTGSVYGEASILPTPENAPFPIQTSLYGASKLAGEGLIQAYCESFDFQAWIFRFVSILGERYSHGHVFDFCQQLRQHPEELRVLGDGSQRKSYLHVQDCIDAIFVALERAQEKINILNLGTEEYCSVKDSVAWITSELGVQPKITYTGGCRGWIGDNPFIFLDTSRVRQLGWKQKLNIRESIARTVRYLKANAWLLEARTRETPQPEPAYQ